MQLPEVQLVSRRLPTIKVESTHDSLGELIRDGIKKYKCELCGNSTWMGEKIPLELHHKDGDHFNNDFDNLQILCPNCHALEPNYRGSNKISHKNKVLKIEKIKNIQDTFDSGVNYKNTQTKKERKCLFILRMKTNLKNT